MGKKNKKKKRQTIRKIEVVTNIEFLSENMIVDVLKSKNVITKWAYILHDKDTYTEEDEKKDATHKAGALKHPHWHIAISFKDSTNMQTVANWFKLPIQCLQKSKSGYFEDMAKYLIHKNASEKYQYLPTEVISNFNYEKFIEKGKIQTRIEEITELIIDGVIREFNYTQYITPFEFQLYKSQIEKAYEFRRDMLYNGNRDLEVIFITGNSGLGKTVLAKTIASQKGYSYFVSGSDNDPLDGYKGQDCLILDDIRGSSMKFSNFIKMIDNNTDSKVQSRFHNKSLTECKLVIITSIHNMEEFYKNIFSEQDEPLVQFRRRCKTLINIENVDYFISSCYDKESDMYIPVGRYKNPARDYIINKEREKYTSANMSEFLGISQYIVLDIEKHIISLDLEKKVQKVNVPF